MKKLYFLLLSLASGSCAFAQAVPNAGMETWRTGTSGTGPVINIQAPDQWYGIDSLIIADGEAFGSFIGAGSNWNPQIFHETTIYHGGTSSAKLITVKQDTLGYFAGILSNSVVNVNVAAIVAGATPASAITFSGGTPIAGRIATVSAWVQYTAGKDSTGTTGFDSGSLTVNVFSHLSTGIDSMVGTGIVNIGPSTSFAYTDLEDGADTVRILFASSGQTDVSDSSTLYVDDVTMTYASNLGVKNVAANKVVKVYPNPASETLYIDANGNEGADFTLFSVNGQVVGTKVLSGNEAVDVSFLPDGLYFYTVTGKDNTVQRGKISVVR